MTQLYLLRAEEARALPAAFCARWFPARVRRAGKMPPDTAALCLAAGALIAGVLHLHEDALRAGQYGKPCAPGVFFSLSHSGGYALLAAAESDVGADLEWVRPAPERVAARVFTPDEQCWLADSTDYDTRFFTLWTLKEALLKTCGRGLTLPLQSLDVLPLLRGQSVQTPEGAFFGSTQQFDGYCLAVCTRTPGAPTAPQRLTSADILCACGFSRQTTESL